MVLIKTGGSMIAMINRRKGTVARDWVLIFHLSTIFWVEIKPKFFKIYFEICGTTLFHKKHKPAISPTPPMQL